MTRRQTKAPHRWLIVAAPPDRDFERRLPSATGVIVLGPSGDLARRLRRRTRARGLVIVEERSGHVARVHDLAELRLALLARTPMILLSPIHPTTSHPGRPPIPRMRAAAMARLARRRLIALGGMDEARFRRLAPLGFQGWAGISAFRT